MGFRILTVLGLCWAAGARAAEPPPRSVVHLINGSFLPGELRGSADSQVLRWESTIFARPLEFPLSAVKAVHYPGPATPPKAAGEFAFELVDDDMLFGNLVGWTDDDLEIQSALLSRLHVRRDQVRRISRWKDSDAIYLGPNGLAGWNEPAPGHWRDEGGHVCTDRPRATLFSDLGVPERAIIEVEVSWKTKPDFAFFVGVSNREDSLKSAFRIEVWDGHLVAVGESSRDADIAVIQTVGSSGGQARIQMLVDQKERRLIVLSRNGKPLATLQIADKKPVTAPGVRLTNIKGDVRLEYLRIGRWNGIAPRDVADDQSRVQKSDGSIVYGQIVRFDTQTKQFMLRDGDKDTAIASEAVSDVFLASPRASEKQSKERPSAPMMRVVYRDGSRFTGEVKQIEDEHVTMTGAGFGESLRLPLTAVRALVVLGHVAGPNELSAAGKPGRLELDGASMTGRLVSGDSPPDASQLIWHPDLSRNSSALRSGLSGRIVYREPVPAAKVQKPVAEPEAGPIRNIWSSKPRPEARTIATGQPSLHLRTGDAVPCEIIRIDERGVTLKTPQSDVTFLTHDKIKSVEFVASKEGPSLDETKRDRLLTLPRMQRDSPPTHLICSKNGDFLRGRIVEMDDSRIAVEVRLERKEIPRDRIAQIIWLHADELKDPKGTAASARPSGGTRVQVINAAGNRLTFQLETADGQTVAGPSEALGACRANLADADQLLFGSFIEMSVAQLAYHSWRLHHAVEPKFAQSDGGASADGGSTGLESPLVGQPAPQFQLDLLDGPRFKLADRKGRVVVLDFWATWCGPCLQSMPQVEEVARGFADQGVELVAVNMEEQPEAVKSMLERHKLKLTVALDRDGAVAGKYSVTAIPQTVVIDRDGKVARLFVGGGKGTVDGLKKALQELTAK
jgi:thiol-disulfide isomerase/thioredoxin